MTARLLNLPIGMRVVTPLGKIARVVSLPEATGDDDHVRVQLEYFHDCAAASQFLRDQFSVRLQPCLLLPYYGDMVLWPDEVRKIQMRAKELEARG